VASGQRGPAAAPNEARRAAAAARDGCSCAMGMRGAGMMEGREGGRTGRAVPAAPGKVTVAVVLLLSSHNCVGIRDQRGTASSYAY